MPLANKSNSAGTATTAGSATIAGSAGTANDSGAVNGMHVAKIDFRAPDGTGETTILSANGLTLLADCGVTRGSLELDLRARTSVENSEIYEDGAFGVTHKAGSDDDFDVGNTENVGFKIGDATQDDILGYLVYSTPDGAVVTAQFSISDSGTHGSTDFCDVEGTAIYS